MHLALPLSHDGQHFHLDREAFRFVRVNVLAYPYLLVGHGSANVLVEILETQPGEFWPFKTRYDNKISRHDCGQPFCISLCTQRLNWTFFRYCRDDSKLPYSLLCTLLRCLGDLY